MPDRVRVHRPWRRLVAAAIFAIGVLAVDAGSVAAECQGSPPSFRDALSTAERIVVGDVVALRDGGLAEPRPNRPSSSRFTLRIRYVLRGQAPAVVQIRDLVAQPCAGVIVARKGDRIAIAFDALDYTPPIRVNAVAWIRGTPELGNETITEMGLFRRLGLQAPDTAIVTPHPPKNAPVSEPAFLAVAGLLGLALGWRRSGSGVAGRPGAADFRRLCRHRASDL